MKILLLTPPLTQANTPYPATPYLYGFLKEKGFDVAQRDPSLMLLLQLISKEGLKDIEKELQLKKGKTQFSDSVNFFMKNASLYQATVEMVITFLQNKDKSLESKILQKNFLPRGPRFHVLKDLEAQYGRSLQEVVSLFGYPNPAKFLASLYIDDLNDVIKQGIDARFELSKYAEKLAASSNSFDPIYKALFKSNTLVDRYIDKIAEEIFDEVKPDVVGMTLPFPGNVYAGFRMAKVFKNKHANGKVLFGGGYVNTELRQREDVRVLPRY